MVRVLPRGRRVVAALVGRRKLVELGEICLCWSADYLVYIFVSAGP